MVFFYFYSNFNENTNALVDKEFKLPAQYGSVVALSGTNSLLKKNIPFSAGVSLKRLK